MGFIDFIVAVDTTTTFFFKLWQVSRIWPILLQLVHVNVDLIVTCITGLDILSLAFSVVSG